jgi:hypothetical protein
MRKVLSHHGLRFSRDLAGYAARGLTQPTGTIWVTDAGIKPWQSFTQLSENKIYSNKVGWDKQSVPNMFVEEHQMFSISCKIFAWNPPLDCGGFLGHIGAE